MKLNDLVRFHDWSWHLNAKTLSGFAHIDTSVVPNESKYLHNEDFGVPKYCTIFKIISFGSFPANNSLVECGVLSEECRRKNNVMVENLETKERIFTQTRNLHVPVLFRKFEKVIHEEQRKEMAKMFDEMDRLLDELIKK